MGHVSPHGLAREQVHLVHVRAVAKPPEQRAAGLAFGTFSQSLVDRGGRRVPDGRDRRRDELPHRCRREVDGEIGDVVLEEVIEDVAGADDGEIRRQQIRLLERAVALTG
jgi:hypothetical protein